MSKIIYTKEVLEKAVKESTYLTDVFKALGAKQGGNTYQRVRMLIKQYEIDTSHFLNGKYKGFLKSGIAVKKCHLKILLYDESRNRRECSYLLKRALIESGRTYVCECCGLEPKWNGKELTLQVDHIDGNWRDNRKENLRFLCPNCHTQTQTFGNKKERKKCENCNMKITKKSRWCQRCFPLFFVNKRKVENRPEVDVLKQEVEEFGYAGTGRKYGVSDNTIRKWIKIETKKLNV